MKQIAISLLLAGTIFGVVVGVARPRQAEADVFSDTYDYCVANADTCLGLAQAAYNAAIDLYGFFDDLFGDISYYEECFGEGCSTEEVRETHAWYKEEMIGESGGSYEEIIELAFHDDHRAALDPHQQDTFILAMLRDFQNRGWVVRQQDIDRAINGG